MTSSVVTLTSGANGGCHGVLVNTGSGCQETEEYDASLTGETNSVTATGITVCNPAGCRFDPNDAPCQTGERTGTYTETTVLSGATMTAARNDAQAICHSYGLPTTTIWIKQ